jgi:microcystin-dependent protein
VADPFFAEIRIFGFTFPPKGWAACDGQLLPISQNTALFSLLGTVYGGDGKSTFALPDLRGCAPMHPGQGQTLHDLGEQGGTEAVALLASEIPVHTHALQARDEPGDAVTPTGNALGRFPGAYGAAPPDAAMAAQVLAPTGESHPHPNMQPYLTLQFCIALQGVYPPRP